jgi:hypothetical protein
MKGTTMTKETPPPSHDATDDEQARRNAKKLAMANSTLVQTVGSTRPSLFELGRVVATPGALQLLERTNTDAMTLLNRHRCGDWGVVDAHDADANEYALQAGARLLSAYELGDAKEPLWIITESDRSVTTLLLPTEY